jgi:integrase
MQRETEVAGMTWAELSPDLTTWELPGRRTKNGKPHTVHLAEPARAILRAVPRAPGARLVFSTTGRTAISGFSHAKVRLDAAIAKARAEAAAEAGRKSEAMPPWRLHDFRRTGVTALARINVRWEVADKVLNHTTGAISGVAAIYQRHDFLAERAAALDAWAAHVLAVGKANAPAGDGAEPGAAEPATSQ